MNRLMPFPIQSPRHRWLAATWCLALALTTQANAEPATPSIPPQASGANATVMASASERFANPAADETPNFQKHITPLLGRLGCNGRACHGSFQGRGDFRLSLFGYDFRADYDALLEEGASRVDTDDVEESLILSKPIDADMHEGGKRMDKDSWQYNVLRTWIERGATFDPSDIAQLERLEVIPSEIQFTRAGEEIDIRVVAHWTDGTAEDVTALSRFSSNDDAIALIDEDGHVSSGEKGDTHVVVYYDNAVVPISVLQPISTPRVTKLAPETHPIDALVQQKLDKLGVVPAPVCSDEDFIRRASLDITGTLPSPTDVRRFLADSSPDKRARLVDDLLDQPAYAAWWATRMSDWTGNSEEQLNNVLPIRNVASKLWYEWLRERLADNLPYDQIVEGIVVANSRQPGEDYEAYCDSMSEACRPGGEKLFAERDGMPLYWARRNFRLPEERAIGFAYAFLGVRIECAQCHKHPFDQWSKNDFDEFAKLFTPVNASQNAVAKDSRAKRDEILASLGGNRELRGNELRKMLDSSLRDGKTVPFPELVIDPSSALRQAKAAKEAQKKKKKVELRIPSGKILGEADEVELDQDPRIALMRWLRSSDNPYFAKAIVNRVWANYFGIGIVDPTDDMNLANPPSNAPLIDYLASEFIKHDFDLKWLHRTITASDTYQRSSEFNATNELDRRNFARHIPRRYPAEVVHDAVLLATLNDERATEIRSTLTGMAITDAISLYGPQRGNTFALDVFGRSSRESNCDCDRSDSPSLLQSVYLKNDTDIHRRLAEQKGWVNEACDSLGVSMRNKNTVDPNLAERTLRMKQAIKSRIVQFNRLPANKQEMNRAKLEEQYKQQAAKFGASGIELPELSALLRDPKLLDPNRDPAPQAQANVDNEKTTALKSVIEDAYLRSLSRFPSDAELETTTTFVNESKSKADAIESVLWALLNTKEFILSH